MGAGTTTIHNQNPVFTLEDVIQKFAREFHLPIDIETGRIANFRNDEDVNLKFIEDDLVDTVSIIQEGAGDATIEIFDQVDQLSKLAGLDRSFADRVDDIYGGVIEAIHDDMDIEEQTRDELMIMVYSSQFDLGFKSDEEVIPNYAIGRAFDVDRMAHDTQQLILATHNTFTAYSKSLISEKELVKRLKQINELKAKMNEDYHKSMIHRRIHDFKGMLKVLAPGSLVEISTRYAIRQLEGLL